jgi:hypothetical protein
MGSGVRYRQIRSRFPRGWTEEPEPPTPRDVAPLSKDKAFATHVARGGDFALFCLR